MSILDQIDEALSGSGKSAFGEDKKPGDKVRGPIVDVDYRQVSDYTTKQPAVFPSGDPKMQFVIRIQAQEPDGDDDGIRAVYIPAWGKRKQWLADAIRDAGATKGSEIMVPGTIFEAEYLGEQKVTGGPSGSYTMGHWRYSFTKAGSSAAAEAADQLGADTPPPGFTADQWAGMPEATKAAIRAAQQ